MKELKLSPDDVLKGVGEYRSEITVKCPACGHELHADRTQDTATCDCGEQLRLTKPFTG